jgi:hypothetical protein
MHSRMSAVGQTETFCDHARDVRFRVISGHRKSAFGPARRSHGPWPEMAPAAPFLKGLSRPRGDSHSAISAWPPLGDSERGIALRGVENGAGR